jgi:hypothetical protein
MGLLPALITGGLSLLGGAMQRKDAQRQNIQSFEQSKYMARYNTQLSKNVAKYNQALSKGFEKWKAKFARNQNALDVKSNFDLMTDLGFNPLTALGAGSLTKISDFSGSQGGYAQAGIAQTPSLTPVQGLGSVVADAISTGYQAYENAEAKELDLKLARLQVETAQDALDQRQELTSYLTPSRTQVGSQVVNSLASEKTEKEDRIFYPQDIPSGGSVVGPAVFVHPVYGQIPITHNQELMYINGEPKIYDRGTNAEDHEKRSGEAGGFIAGVNNIIMDNFTPQPHLSAWNKKHLHHTPPTKVNDGHVYDDYGL